MGASATGAAIEKKIVWSAMHLLDLAKWKTLINKKRINGWY